MTVRYEYKSACCGHEYTEQRGKDEPMFFPTCNSCGNADYELVSELVLAPDIEVSPGLVVEVPPVEAPIE